MDELSNVVVLVGIAPKPRLTSMPPGEKRKSIQNHSETYSGVCQ